ncbi:MAG: alpha/beta hydrolase, partial [Fibrobacter sp.]|nr:alpha/beta hydrolase [Fibrobacter sp.]
MLLNKFMTEITINTISFLADLALHLTPAKQMNESEFLDKAPVVGSSYSGWDYKEIKSPDSGFTHRYFYYPGPFPNSPVFVFLHGLIFDGRNFVNTKALGDKWQLVAYDFPESTDVYRGDMNDFRFLLDDFLDTIKKDTIYLCGVSFGGGIAARYAASHARRVKALILVSTFIMNALPSDRLKSRQLARILLKQPDQKLYWLLDKILSRA